MAPITGSNSANGMAILLDTAVDTRGFQSSSDVGPSFGHFSRDGGASCACLSSGSSVCWRTALISILSNSCLDSPPLLLFFFQVHLDLALRFSAFRDVCNLGQAFPSLGLPRTCGGVPRHLRAGHPSRPWLRRAQLGWLPSSSLVLSSAAAATTHASRHHDAARRRQVWRKALCWETLTTISRKRS